MKKQPFNTDIFTARTFGIEIEAFIPNALAEQFNAGTASNPEPIANAPATADGGQWACARDSSIQGGPIGYFGAEVVSPVLSGEAGFTDLLVMLDYLAEIGVQVNASCGIHIHVFAGDLSKAQQQRVIDIFTDYEKGFFALNGSQARSRWSNAFCVGSDCWLVSDIGMTETAKYSNYRYQSLNWQNIQEGRSQCFEFRLFAGDIVASPDLLLSTLLTCLHFVGAVKSNRLRRSQTARRLRPSTAAHALQLKLGLLGCPELAGLGTVTGAAAELADVAFGYPAPA